MKIILYVDTISKKVKSLTPNSYQPDWTSHIISMHGYIIDNPFSKIPSAPDKLQFSIDGYKKTNEVKEKIRPSGYIDIIIGGDITTINPYAEFLKTVKKLIDDHTTNPIGDYEIIIFHKHPKRHNKLPKSDPILNNEFIRDSFVVKLAGKLNATLSDELMPSVISNDLINMGCLETVAQGRTLHAFSTDPRYWKRNSRPLYLRGDTQLALNGDTGREYRSMQYDTEDMVSTEKFNSTNTAHFVTKGDKLYTDTLAIFNKWFNKPEHQKILIEVDVKGLYSKQLSALYNKFGVGIYHVLIGTEDTKSSIILGDFYNGQTKDMVTITPMVRVPDPTMVMTRLFLTELFRLGLMYITEGESVLETSEYDHITRLDIVPVEWDGDFLSKIVVQGKHWKMPFVPQVGFHSEQLSDTYAKLKNRRQYSMAIESNNIVYHAIVVGNDKLLYAGAV